MEVEQQQKKEYQSKIWEFFIHKIQFKENQQREQKEIEKLIQQEIDRQWEKKLKIWKREEESWVKLMKEVYEQRFRNIEEKKDRLRQEKILIEKERLKIQQDFVSY